MYVCVYVPTLAMYSLLFRMRATTAVAPPDTSCSRFFSLSAIFWLWGDSWWNIAPWRTQRGSALLNLCSWDPGFEYVFTWCCLIIQCSHSLTLSTANRFFLKKLKNKKTSRMYQSIYKRSDWVLGRFIMSCILVIICVFLLVFSYMLDNPPLNYALCKMWHENCALCLWGKMSNYVTIIHTQKYKATQIFSLEPSLD